MASAALGLTPRWLMLLSAALLLLLLPAASAQEPSAMSKAWGVSREPGGRRGGRLGRLQGGAQPAGFESTALTPSLRAAGASPAAGVTSFPKARKDRPSRNRGFGTCSAAGWLGFHSAGFCISACVRCWARRFEELKSCTMPDSLAQHCFFWGQSGSWQVVPRPENERVGLVSFLTFTARADGAQLERESIFLDRVSSGSLKVALHCSLARCVFSW